jgi:hypothetical protein
MIPAGFWFPGNHPFSAGLIIRQRARNDKFCSLALFSYLSPVARKSGGAGKQQNGA